MLSVRLQALGPDKNFEDPRLNYAVLKRVESAARGRPEPLGPKDGLMGSQPNEKGGELEGVLYMGHDVVLNYWNLAEADKVRKTPLFCLPLLPKPGWWCGVPVVSFIPQRRGTPPKSQKLSRWLNLTRPWPCP